MANFRASIRGQRGEASRLGSKKSGISANVNGWNIGIRVSGNVNAAGEDEFTVYVTSGSNGRHTSKHLGTFTARDFGAENG